MKPIKTSHYLYIGASLVLLLLTSLYYFFTDALLPHSRTNDNQADQYGYGIKMKKFNEMGVLIESLTAATMVHYPKNDTTYYTSPIIILTPPKKSIWHLSAKYGKDNNKDSILTLWSHVVIFQPATQTKPETKILTSRMHYNQKSRIAYSKQPTTIIRPNSVTHGVGVNINFNTDTYQLLSDTNITYTPTTKEKS